MKRKNQIILVCQIIFCILLSYFYLEKYLEKVDFTIKYNSLEEFLIWSSYSLKNLTGSLYFIIFYYLMITDVIIVFCLTLRNDLIKSEGIEKIQKSDVYIPEDLLLLISPDERILFISDEISRERELFRRSFILHCIEIVAIFVMFMIFWTRPFIIWVIFLIGLKVLLQNPNPPRHTYYFVITDKNFHIYDYYTFEASGYLKTIELSTIQSLICKQHRSQKPGGTIEIIYDLPYTLFYLLELNNFLFYQTLLESVLYEYGNLRNRIDILKEQNNFDGTYKFPTTNGEIVRLENGKILAGKKTMEFNKTVTLAYLCINTSYGNNAEWARNFDGIKVISLQKPKQKLKIGPFLNFSEVYEKLYCSLLHWKSYNQLLYPKSSLQNLTYLHNQEKRSRKREQIINVEKIIKRDIHISIPSHPSADNLVPFKEFLKKEEKSLAVFHPQPKFTKLYLHCAILVASWALLSLFLFIQVSSFTRIYFLIVTIGITIGIAFIPNKFYVFKARKSTYLITNKGLHIKKPSSYKFLAYSDIREIGRYFYTSKKYGVDIVGYSTKNNRGNRLVLYDIPNELDLFELLISLKSESKKKVTYQRIFQKE